MAFEGPTQTIQTPEDDPKRDALGRLENIQAEVFRVIETKLTEDEKDKIPSGEGSRGDRINYLIERALERVTKNDDDYLKYMLVGLVKHTYLKSPKAERFIFDPARKGTLMIDADSELVTLRGSKISTIQKGIQGEGIKYIESYDSSEVLSGPNKGKIFKVGEHPVPAPQLKQGDLGYAEESRG